MCYHGNGKQQKAKLTTYIFAQSFVAQLILHFRYGINFLSRECTVQHTHKMSYMEDLPLHIFLPQLFLQPQWTGSLQQTASPRRVTHSGCICSSLLRAQHQSFGWDEAQAPLEYLLVSTRILLGRWSASRTPGRWGNPLRWGKPPSYINSHSIWSRQLHDKWSSPPRVTAPAWGSQPPSINRP